MNSNIFIIVILIACYFTLSASVQYNKEAQWASDNYHKHSEQAGNTKLPEKEKFIEKYRQYLYDNDLYIQRIEKKYSVEKFIPLLREDVTFAVLNDKMFEPSKWNQADNRDSITEVFERICFLSNKSKGDKSPFINNKKSHNTLKKSIIHYVMIEISLSNEYTRFHASCFAIPRAAVWIYFKFPGIIAVENGKEKDILAVKTCDRLKTFTLQTWTSL